MNEDIIPTAILRQRLDEIVTGGGQIITVLPHKLATKGNILRSLDAELVSVRVLWK